MYCVMNVKYIAVENLEEKNVNSAYRYLNDESWEAVIYLDEGMVGFGKLPLF